MEVQMSHERGTFEGGMCQSPFDNKLVQSQRPPDPTNTTQQGRRAAAMWPVTSITVATYQYNL